MQFTEMKQTAQPNNNGSDRLLTVEEVAEMLRVPKSWVYERTRRCVLGEQLPHVKLGKYLRFEKEAVLEFVGRLRRGGRANA